MSNEKLKETLQSALMSKEEITAQDKPAEDVDLTDADLDDVAGGLCNGMCGTFSVGIE